MGCLEVFEQKCQRLPAVADAELFFCRNFSKRTPQGWTKKQRIVSETLSAAWRVKDLSLHGSAKGADQFASIRKRDHAHEPRAPVADAVERSHEAPVVLDVGRANARVTRR